MKLLAVADAPELEAEPRLGGGSPQARAYVCRACRTQPAPDWRTLCARCRASQCDVCGGLNGIHRNAHRAPSVPVPEPISAPDLEAVLLSGYGLAHRHARAIAGDGAAWDCVHSALVKILQRRAFLSRVTVWYFVQAAKSEALLMLRSCRRVVLVDDFERVELGQRRAERGRRVGSPPGIEGRG